MGREAADGATWVAPAGELQACYGMLKHSEPALAMQSDEADVYEIDAEFHAFSKLNRWVCARQSQNDRGANPAWDGGGDDHSCSV